MNNTKAIQMQQCFARNARTVRTAHAKTTLTAVASLGMALLLALSALFTAAPARADGLMGHVLGMFGMQESSKLAKAYAVLREDFYPTSVVWSPNGKYIADTGMLTDVIHVWDANTRQVVQTLKNVAPTAGYQALAWSPDGRYLVGCGAGLRIWDTTNWGIVRDNALDRRDTGNCNAIAFSPDGRWLAVGPGQPTNADTCIYSTGTWTLKACTSFRKLPIFHGFAFHTQKIAFQPGTDTLAIAATGWFDDPDKWDGKLPGPPSGRVLFWDVNGPPPDLRKDDVAHSLLAYPDGSVRSIAYSPDGKQLATGTLERSKEGPGDTVLVWDTGTHGLLAKPLGGPSEDAGVTYALAYTADGHYLLAGFSEKNGPIDIIDAHTLRLVDVVHASGSASMEAIAVEPHGPRFVVTSDRYLMVWTLQDKH